MSTSAEHQTKNNSDAAAAGLSHKQLKDRERKKKKRAAAAASASNQPNDKLAVTTVSSIIKGPKLRFRYETHANYNFIRSVDIYGDVITIHYQYFASPEVVRAPQLWVGDASKPNDFYTLIDDQDPEHDDIHTCEQEKLTKHIHIRPKPQFLVHGKFSVADLEMLLGNLEFGALATFREEGLPFYLDPAIETEATAKFITPHFITGGRKVGCLLALEETLVNGSKDWLVVKNDKLISTKAEAASAAAGTATAAALAPSANPTMSVVGTKEVMDTKTTLDVFKPEDLVSVLIPNQLGLILVYKTRKSTLSKIPTLSDIAIQLVNSYLAPSIPKIAEAGHQIWENIGENYLRMKGTKFKKDDLKLYKELLKPIYPFVDYPTVDGDYEDPTGTERVDPLIIEPERRDYATLGKKEYTIRIQNLALMLIKLKVVQHVKESAQLLTLTDSNSELVVSSSDSTVILKPTIGPALPLHLLAQRMQAINVSASAIMGTATGSVTASATAANAAITFTPAASMAASAAAPAPIANLSPNALVADKHKI